MAENKIIVQNGGASVEIPVELLLKYDRQVPRYTSYPTAPVWREFSAQDFSAAISALTPSAKLSLYLHIPFCEERCAFCGCSTIATRKKSAARDYLRALLAEIELVAKTPCLAEVESIHFGGGTPTFLSVEALSEILRQIAKHFRGKPSEISIELDPRRVSVADVVELGRLGFTRASFGVQDLDENVGGTIGRVCTYEKLARLVDAARGTSFRGVNIDLVYGLPAQSSESFSKTADKILSISPDRVACFNFAYLPGLLPHQRKLDPSVMPMGPEKFKIFVAAMERFTCGGFNLIGLDHFAKSTDELYLAVRNGELTRNFQGYVPHRGVHLIGLGLTSISELHGCFAQNTKKLAQYYRCLSSGSQATVRGMKLSADDLLRQKQIADIMCLGRCNLYGRGDFSELENDGLIDVSGDILKLTELGRFFARNVAAAFDGYLNCGASFSRSV